MYDISLTVAKVMKGYYESVSIQYEHHSFLLQYHQIQHLLFDIKLMID